MVTFDLQSVAYNIFFGFMFLLWWYRNHPVIRIADRIKHGSIIKIWLFALIYVPIMSIMVIFYLQSDVSTAITTGVQGFLNGINVYKQNVVVHYLSNGKQVDSVYHYFPPDLFVNSFFFLLFGWIDNVFNYPAYNWLVITNIFFIIGLYPLMRKVVDLEDIRLIPCYIVFMCHFLATNSILMLIFFVFGYYFLQRKQKTLGYTNYVLSASIKYMTGLYLVIFFLEDLNITLKDKNITRFIPYIIGILVLTILMLPFGIIQVIIATLFYQGDISKRIGIASVEGPLLVEIMLIFNLLSYYDGVFIITSIITVIIAWKIGKNTYERQMLLAFSMMFLLPFMATELFIIPMFSWFFTMMNNNEDTDPLLNPDTTKKVNTLSQLDENSLGDKLNIIKEA